MDGHSEERPSSAQPYLGGISRCVDYWQQAELRTDGACRIPNNDADDDVISGAL